MPAHHVDTGGNMFFTRLPRARWALAAALAMVIVAALALPAMAANSVTQTSNSNKLTVSVGHSGNNFSCSGTNMHSNGVAVPKVLVSAICQYRDSMGGWHDFESAPANSCTNCVSTSVTYQDNPCVSTDGGANLPAGTWAIRGQADGYWVDGSGARHDWGSGSAALATTSPFPTASCSS
jgi:hypothetical protein